MSEIVEMGSLFFDGKPVEPGAMYDKGIITIGNTVPEMEILFNKWNNLYVATECVCTGIAWEGLTKHGYVFGRPVRIDGTPYLCRSLKVGAERDVPSEWDAILDDLGEDNELWHWKGQYFWGQETSVGRAYARTVRGYHSARWRNQYSASSRYADIGFRPVLEPLPPEPQISDAMVGSNLRLYGGNYSITGRLVGYNAYDLELVVAGPLPAPCSWIRPTKGIIYVDREAITYLCGEEMNHGRNH